MRFAQKKIGIRARCANKSGKMKALRVRARDRLSYLLLKVKPDNFDRPRPHENSPRGKSQANKHYNFGRAKFPWVWVRQLEPFLKHVRIFESLYGKYLINGGPLNSRENQHKTGWYAGPWSQGMCSSLGSSGKRPSSCPRGGTRYGTESNPLCARNIVSKISRNR